MKIRVGDDEVSAAYDPPDGEQRAIFVCAHGAGGSFADKGMLAASRAMTAAGLGVLRFNFCYREKKSGRPDPMPKLQQCIEAVTAYARDELEPRKLLIGGRSMGGRAASMLAADGFEADGMLLLAYPLHPPGRLDQLRDEHLPAITMPVLCFNGTRDEYCDMVLMRETLSKVRAFWTMHWLDGADHAFHVLKSSGRGDADVLREVTDTTSEWLDPSRNPTLR